VSRNPYSKGPLKKGEIPRMVVGAGILFGGLYGVTKYLTSRTRAVAASVANPVAGPVATSEADGPTAGAHGASRGPAIERGSRFR